MNLNKSFVRDEAMDAVPNGDKITKVTQILERVNGSQVKIVAQVFYGAGLHESVGVYVHRRENSKSQWEYCSERSHPAWQSMSVDEYLKHGRSEMLKTVSHAELLMAISMLGEPFHEEDHTTEAAPVG